MQAIPQLQLDSARANECLKATFQFRKKAISQMDSTSSLSTSLRMGTAPSTSKINTSASSKFLFQSQQGLAFKQFLKTGSPQGLNFKKDKKTKVTKDLQMSLPLQNIGNTLKASPSCANIDEIIERLQKKLHKRTSSDQFFFDSDLRSNFSEPTPMFRLSQTIKQPLKISDFQLGKCIGSGKFGDVHRVRHKKTNTLFALKKILKSTILQNRMLSQFVSQLKIMYTLSHHNIIQLYTHFDDEYHIFLLMQYAQGGSLMSKIYNSEEYTAEVMGQMLEAVEYTHKNRIIHRDIKPENIVVMFENTVKLCDFGLAAELKYDNDIRSSFCGTLDYIAPEMKEIGLYGVSVDIWGLGVLCYEVLYGKAPFKEDIRNWKKKGSKRHKHWNWQINYPEYTSQPALDFMASLLKQNPRQRANITQALRSSFIKQNQKDTTSCLTAFQHTFLSKGR